MKSNFQTDYNAALLSSEHCREDRLWLCISSSTPPHFCGSARRVSAPHHYGCWFSITSSSASTVRRSPQQITQKNRSRRANTAKRNYRIKAPWDGSQTAREKHIQGQVSPLHFPKPGRLDLHTNSMALNHKAWPDVRDKVKGQFITVKTPSCDSLGMMTLLDRS